MTEKQLQEYRQLRQDGCTALDAFAYACCADLSIRGVQRQASSIKQRSNRFSFVDGCRPVFESRIYSLSIVSIAPTVWPMLLARKAHLAQHGSLVGYTGN